LLTDYESVKKDKVTGKYIDMCNKCLYSTEKDLSIVSINDFEDAEVDDVQSAFDSMYDET
jgi:hypothetical protein